MIGDVSRHGWGKAAGAGGIGGSLLVAGGSLLVGGDWGGNLRFLREKAFSCNKTQFPSV